MAIGLVVAFLVGGSISKSICNNELSYKTAKREGNMPESKS